MADIHTSIVEEQDLTVHTVTGSVTMVEILQVMTTASSPKPTKLALWNFLGATLADRSSDSIRQAAEDALEIGHLRTGGKTAVVTASDVDFGFARMYQAFSESKTFPYQVMVFHSLEDARKWLGVTV